MTMISIGNMRFGQGPGATLRVEWQNDGGTWESREVVRVGTRDHINHATLDNGFVITEENLNRVRSRPGGEVVHPVDPEGGGST